MRYDKRSFLTLFGVFGVGLLVVSIAGCDGNQNNPTATPTVIPTAQGVQATTSPAVKASTTPQASTTNGYDPLLATIESKLKSEYPADTITTKRLPKNADQSFGDLVVMVSLPNGDNITASFRNESSIAEATNFYETMAKEDSTTNGPANPTHFGQDAVKAALGHSPTVVKDTALLIQAGGASPTPVDYEVIQYDTIVITMNHIWPNS